MFRTLKSVIITLPDAFWATGAGYQYAHTRVQTRRHTHTFPAQLVNVWSCQLKTCPFDSMNHTDTLMPTDQNR